MWDSLESVWRAADEDPECDAYVVPIPYFERNAQGELAAGHYEGNQFPEYVLKEKNQCNSSYSCFSLRVNFLITSSYEWSISDRTSLSSMSPRKDT